MVRNCDRISSTWINHLKKLFWDAAFLWVANIFLQDIVWSNYFPEEVAHKRETCILFVTGGTRGYFFPEHRYPLASCDRWPKLSRTHMFVGSVLSHRFLYLFPVFSVWNSIITVDRNWVIDSFEKFPIISVYFQKLINTKIIRVKYYFLV